MQTGAAGDEEAEHDRNWRHRCSLRGGFFVRMLAFGLQLGYDLSRGTELCCVVLGLGGHTLTA